MQVGPLHGSLVGVARGTAAFQDGGGHMALGFTRKGRIINARDAALRGPDSRFLSETQIRRLREQGVVDALELPVVTTLVGYACMVKDADAIKALRFNVDLNDSTPEGFSPIHIATIMADRLAIWLLLDAGADADTKDAQGNTALHLAVKHRYRRENGIPEELVRRGASPWALDASGRTPLEALVHERDRLFPQGSASPSTAHESHHLISRDIEDFGRLVHSGAN